MESKIPFHRPYFSGLEQVLVTEVITSGEISTGGRYSAACEKLLNNLTGAKHTLLTSSCTHALEMAALLLDIQPGDEIIMPSFTFVSAANAFALRGAKVVFVDIDPNTMNIDPDCIAPAINSKTKAVLIMHYGGVACDMDRIMPIIKSHDLVLIEDAAHCIGAKYKDQHLGTFGQLGTLSFHYTKNVHCGEGGALLINDEQFLDRAEILREKGTNRKQFFAGKIDKYSWVDLGSSYLMSELSAAFLYAQLRNLDKVNAQRIALWQAYDSALKTVQNITTCRIADNCKHNGHLFYIKCQDQQDRSEKIALLKSQGIQSSFHYIPLHSSLAGKRFGIFHGTDKYTSQESAKLLRLPLHTELSMETIDFILRSLMLQNA